MSATVNTEERPHGAATPKPDGARHQPTDEPTPGNPAADAFHAIPPLLGELKSYASHYISARIDGIKLTARKIALFAVLGLIGAFVAVGFLVTAVGLLLVGIAHGLGTLMWNQLWLGDLLVGLLVLGGVALAAYLGVSKVFKSSRKQTEQKYEGKRIQERVQHGRDVSERARLAKESKAGR